MTRNGKVCEGCIGNLPWKEVFYGCYRNSRFYSLPVALTQGIHRLAGTWKDKVDAYIALTEFGRDKFIENGLPAEKIFVKPNFLSNPPEANYSHEDYAVFIDRISIEKGVHILVDTFKKLRSKISSRFSLKIIGDGPLFNQIQGKDKVEVEVGVEGVSNIEFVGRKSFTECMELLRYAQFMILPSLCYEGFPMVIREAFACGKPVIASRLGSMAEIVEGYMH